MRVAAIALALLTTPALALPPAGIAPGDAEHLWWECHIQPTTKRVCCRESDGHVLGDNDWRAAEKPDAARAYQVRVGGKWFDIPMGAVINDFRHCGPEPNSQRRSMAKVWYAPVWDGDGIIDIKVYCFIAGTMY